MSYDFTRLLGPSTDAAAGTLATVPASGVCYVRCRAGNAVEKLDWLLQGNRAHTYQFYRTHQLPGTLSTLTLSGLLNTETFFIMGSTYTGATSTTTWSTGGISIATSMDACAGLLVKAINGGKVVTLASITDADYVTIDGTVVNAHADTTTAANHEFAIDGATDALDAAQFVLACSGDGAIDGITVTQGAGTGEVLIAYTDDKDNYPTVTSSNGTRLAVTTIGQTYISATKTGTAIVSLSDYFAQNLKELTEELKLQLERTAIYGLKHASSPKGTSAIPRTMYGIRYYLDRAGANRVTDGYHTPNEDLINYMCRMILAKNGQLNNRRGILACSPANAEIIGDIWKDKIQINREDTTRGTQVKTIVTKLGFSLDVVWDQNIHNNDLFILNPNKIEIAPLQNRAWFVKRFDAGSDGQQARIIGEWTTRIFDSYKDHAICTCLETA